MNTTCEDVATKNERLRNTPEANECRHFNGIQHDVCAAGIRYHDVSRVAAEGTLGCALRLPCRHSTEDEYPCASLSRFTDEEITELDREHDAHIGRFLVRVPIVRRAIIADIGIRLKKFVGGEVACPICGSGTVTYTYSGHVNGHIHAACSTPDCISWGE